MQDMPEQDALTNVARYLPLIAETQPDVCAVRAAKSGGKGQPVLYESRTFRELEEESRALALLLQNRGIVKGTRTLLMVKPGLDLIRLCFAIFKTGAVPVVIDPGMGLRNFLACVRHTEPEALIGIPLAQGISRIFKSAFVSVDKRVSVQPSLFRKSLAEYHRKPFTASATMAGDLAAILFTSGSTGPPKGVCYTHGMFEAQVRLIKQQYSIAPGEVDLPMLPVFALFNPALGMTTITPQMNPSRPAKVCPERLVRAIRQNEVTNSFGSPVLWRKLSRYCLHHGITLPSLKRILMAGAPAPPSLIEELGKVFPNATAHTPYGATECLPVTSVTGIEILGEARHKAAAGAGTCVGKPLPEMQVKTILIDDGPIDTFTPSLETQPGDIGEVVVKGPVVTETYFRLPDATEKAKMSDANGEIWHRMGDLGYFDEQGNLWFCGRKVERVTCADFTLYTDCCEAIVNCHEKVYRSALIGLGAKGHQEPAFVIEPEERFFPVNRKTRHQFAIALRERVCAFPHTRSIRRFYFHRQFPVDVRHNAKIHRLTLARLAADGKLRGVFFRPGDNEVEAL